MFNTFNKNIEQTYEKQTINLHTRMENFVTGYDKNYSIEIWFVIVNLFKIEQLLLYVYGLTKIYFTYLLILCIWFK